MGERTCVFAWMHPLALSLFVNDYCNDIELDDDDDTAPGRRGAARRRLTFVSDVRQLANDSVSESQLSELFG